MMNKQQSVSDVLRALNPRDFLSFGRQQIAYIRPAVMNGAVVYTIHAADGSPLAFHEDEDMARAITRQNDLEPVTVH